MRWAAFNADYPFPFVELMSPLASSQLGEAVTLTGRHFSPDTKVCVGNIDVSGPEVWRVSVKLKNATTGIEQHSEIELLSDAAKIWFKQVTKQEYRPNVYIGTCGAAGRRRSTVSPAVTPTRVPTHVTPSAKAVTNGTAVVTAATTLKKAAANSTARVPVVPKVPSNATARGAGPLDSAIKRTGTVVRLGNVTFQYSVTRRYIPDAPFLGEVTGSPPCGRARVPS